MPKNNNLKDYLKDLYAGLSTVKPSASRDPQQFRSEIESLAHPADATATAADIRLNKTAYTSEGKVSGTIEDYDNTLLGPDGSIYTAPDGTKPVLTDAVIIANPYKNEPEKITVTIKPTTGKIVTKKEGTFGAFNYHNRFYFDILPGAVGASCLVRIAYSVVSNNGTPFAAIGKLDTITETGSKTADYIITKKTSLNSGGSATCSYTFTNLTEGRHFIDTQVISPAGPYLQVQVMWEIVEG